jgi:hypothetical protein
MSYEQMGLIFCCPNCNCTEYYDNDSDPEKYLYNCMDCPSTWESTQCFTNKEDLNSFLTEKENTHPLDEVVKIAKEIALKYLAKKESKVSKCDDVLL